jgi:hypothetical protein
LQTCLNVSRYSRRRRGITFRTWRVMMSKTVRQRKVRELLSSAHRPAMAPSARPCSFRTSSSATRRHGKSSSPISCPALAAWQVPMKRSASSRRCLVSTLPFFWLTSMLPLPRSPQMTVDGQSGRRPARTDMDPGNDEIADAGASIVVCPDPSSARRDIP